MAKRRAESEDESDYEDHKVKTSDHSLKASTQSKHSVSRTENLRERTETFYGSTDGELVEAINLRFKWGSTMFGVLDEQLDESFETTSVPVFKDALTITSRNRTQKVVTECACTVDGVELLPQECRTNGTSTVINVGFAISCLDLSNGVLAVGVKSSSGTSTKTSSLGDQTNQPTTVYLYGISGSEVHILARLISSNDEGIPVKVKWRPGGSELAVLTGKGNFYVVDVPNISKIPKSSGTKTDRDKRELGVPTYSMSMKALNIDIGKASCLAWRDDHTVVVGYTDGWIVEFDISSDSYHIPTFVLKAHTSLVSALEPGNGELSNYIFSSSVDGWSSVIDTKDLRSLHRPGRVRFYSNCATYIPMVRSFVTVDDHDTTKMISIAQPTSHQAISITTIHDSMVTSLGGSDKHPLLASGAQNGTVHITNTLRRTMITRRQKNGMQDMLLWQFQCSDKSSSYRFVEFNEVRNLEHRKTSAKLRVYSPSVAVVEVVWNGKCLITATGSGLIRLDNMGA